MGRYAKKIFGWAGLFLGLALLATPVSILTSVLQTSNASAFSSSGSLEERITAYQYYQNLFVDNKCGLKDDVKGSDILKYNFYSVYGTKFFYVGKIASPERGAYDCGDYGSSTKTFTIAAANSLGLDPSDPGELLCQLGYAQTVASSSATRTSCANSSTRTGGEDAFYLNNAASAVNSHLLATVLKNEKPTWPDVLAYWSTYRDFVLGCNAQEAASGSYGSQVANIAIVNSSGVVVTKGYTYEVGDGTPFAAVGDIGYPQGAGKCADLAKGLSGAPTKYVNAYRDYLLEKTCSQRYSNATEAAACVAGAKNRSNLNYCTNAYGGSAKKAERLACYVGQGNQGQDACIAKYGYTTQTELYACIRGSQNANNSNYCNENYPAPDSIQIGSGSVGPDTNKAARDACLNGQKSPADGAPLGISTGQESEGSSEEAQSSCVIDGWGWLICPAISFLATIADNAFIFLSDNFLRIDVGVIDTSSGTYQAWSVMRTIGNVAFVIAFLFIIFSQLTGAGITNYGIKKMLPRLIIAAILVNISFFVCQLAVDVSNIVGISIKELFDAVGGGISNTQYSSGDESGNVWGILAISVLGGAIAWGLGVAVLLPVLVGAVIALVMIFLILIVRQMLIILLIAIAPLAFVAYLLPNTEQWFTKWRQTFFALLLVFPLIGALFGAAGLASTILKGVYAGTGDIIGQIVAAGVLVLPLFLLPSLLKGSLKATGQLGAKLSGYADSFSKDARGKTANSGLVKNFAANKATKRARVSTGTYKGRGPSGAISWMNRRLNNSQGFNIATGGYGAERTIAGQGQERKDAQEAMAMFGGDDGLVAAWAASGGDASKIPEEFKLNKAQLAQFNLLKNAGHGKKATSFTAAAQYLSENGKGNAEAFASALGTAASLGASETDISNAWETGVAAYRKSGRGDAVGELKAFKKENGERPMISGAAREQFRTTVAGDQALATARAKAWQEVGASSVHREGITPQFDTKGNFDAEKSGGYISYQQHLVTNAENTRAALAGFDSMEARAKAIAQEPILKAARHHQEDATGTPSTIKSIQEAKTYFNIK